MSDDYIPTYLIDLVDSDTLSTLCRIREQCSPRTEDSGQKAFHDYYADITLMLADFIQNDKSSDG
jgi:hypothetical protein